MVGSVASQTWPFDPLTPFCADLLVVDPPWRFVLRSAKGEAKSPQAHYTCQELAWIKSLPVGHLASRDCWLFLWTSAPLLDRAFEVVDAWGFRYVSRLAWRKLTINSKPRLGPGFLVRTLHEDILIATLGDPRRVKPLPSLFGGIAREHSRKPEELYPLLDAFAPAARKVELFARQSRPGWLSWGDQATKFDLEEEGAGNDSQCLRPGLSR